MRWLAWMGVALLGTGCDGSDTGTAECTGGTSRTADVLCLEGDTAVGATVYADNCEVCHGPDATGVAYLGSDIRGEAAQSVIETFFDPPAAMTDFAEGAAALSDQEMADVAAYVESLPPL